MNESHLQFLASPEWAEMLRTDLLPWIEQAGDLGDAVLEVGPGPGLTTDMLRARVAHLTAVEIDADLASQLRQRLADTDVDVVTGDATEVLGDVDRFSAATCFSVLHHIPTAEQQDRLFEVLHRVLRPGGILVGVDALDIDVLRAGHVDDTFVPIDPSTLDDRLARAGFGATTIDVGDYQFRFTATKPG